MTQTHSSTKTCQRIEIAHEDCPQIQAEPNEMDGQTNGIHAHCTKTEIQRPAQCEIETQT